MVCQRFFLAWITSDFAALMLREGFELGSPAVDRSMPTYSNSPPPKYETTEYALPRIITSGTICAALGLLLFLFVGFSTHDWTDRSVDNASVNQAGSQSSKQSINSYRVFVYYADLRKEARFLPLAPVYVTIWSKYLLLLLLLWWRQTRPTFFAEEAYDI